MKTNTTWRRAVAIVLVPVAALSAQPAKKKGAGGGPGGGSPQEREAAAVAEPFRGITANGAVEPELFPLRSTGVDMEPARKAAREFLATLTPEQRGKTTFGIDDPEWRKWMNVHRWPRQGVSFLEMTPAQRDAAFAMIGASLHARGLKLAQDTMKLNHTLAELRDNYEEYGEWRYHITVMGEPSAEEPWGWQIDGHHLAINFFVLRDQAVMAPVFMGSEPVVATGGKYRGTAILQEEQARGLALRQSLTEVQRKAAVLDVRKTANNAVAQAFQDNLVLDYAGLRATELDAKQRADLLGLIELFVTYQQPGHARVKMDEVKAHLDRTYFAWIGGDGPDAVFYFRIHSPVLLIEFDHQLPVGLRGLGPEPGRPFRDHIHAVLRTPNGNDYGKDLLRQHHARRPH